MVEKTASNWVPPVKLDTLLSALCGNSIFTKGDLKHRLKSLRRPTNEIGDSAIEDILTLASTMGLVTKDGGVYHRTSMGDQFCIVGGDDLSEEIKQRLHIQLQSSLRVYQEFLEYLTQPRSAQEIDIRFNQVTGKTLRQWVQFLGVANVDKSEKYQYFPQEQDVDLETFKQALKSCHKQLSRDQMVGTGRYFVDIGELRSEVCQTLRIFPGRFDALLTALLDDSEGRRGIELTGAPATIYEEATTEPFSYRGKIFRYIAVTGA